MKKKFVNHLLLDSLIHTDFLLLKNQYSLKNLNLSYLTSSNNNLYSSILNPLDLLKSLKQFIRIIQLSKNQNNSIINFFVQNRFQKSIIHNFINRNKLSINSKIFFKFLTLSFKKSTFQILLFLKEYLYKELNILKIFLNENFFLVQEINSINFKNKLGTYKIYNNLSDYKKLIFILTIIGYTWQSSYESISNANVKKITKK